MRVHGEIPGRTFLGEVHPVGARTKTLISDTNGALCAWWAHLRGGAHVCRTCAPKVHPIIIVILYHIILVNCKGKLSGTQFQTACIRGVHKIYL